MNDKADFAALVREYLIKMLEATGMGPASSRSNESPEGQARMTAAFALAMQMEHLVNSAPWPQKQREHLLQEARALARSIVADLARGPDKVRSTN